MKPMKTDDNVMVSFGQPPPKPDVLSQLPPKVEPTRKPFEELREAGQGVATGGEGVEEKG